MGALKKTDHNPLENPAADGMPRFIWLPLLLETAIAFVLSPGHDYDAPHGRALLQELGPKPQGLPLLMARAYEGDETRHWRSLSA
jgi:hypothetical protein